MNFKIELNIIQHSDWGCGMLWIDISTHQDDGWHLVEAKNYKISGAQVEHLLSLNLPWHDNEFGSIGKYNKVATVYANHI